MHFPLKQMSCFRNRRIRLSPNNPASKTCDRFCSNLLHFEVHTLELQSLNWRLISITKRKMAHFLLAIKRVLIMWTFRKHYRWYRKLLNIHGIWNVLNLGIPLLCRWRTLQEEGISDTPTVFLTSGTGFFGGSVVKNLPANAGDMGLIPISGPGRYPGEGNGNSLQYSCLEKPMQREAWSAIVHGVARSRTQLRVWTTKAKDTTEQDFKQELFLFTKSTARFILCVWSIWPRKSLSLALNICSYKEQWVSTFSGPGTLSRPGWGEAEMNQAQWLTASNHQHSVDQLIFKVNTNVKCFLLYNPLIQ